MLCDTFHTYTWDAEGRLASVDGKTLTRDAFGRVIESQTWGSTYEVVHSPAGDAWFFGQTFASMKLPLPGGGSARYVGSGGIEEFNHPDWEGNTRLSTTPWRTYYSSIEYAPFGEAYDAGTSSFTWTTAFNGGSSRDMFADMYDTPNRELHPVQGRWIQPDPAGLAAVDPSNPQTWNRYAYVLNNPLSYVDPLGLDCTIFGPDGSQQPCGGGGGPGDGGGPGGGYCPPEYAYCGPDPFPPPGGGGPGGSGPGNPPPPPSSGGTPPSGGGTPPWQEWGGLPPWLTGGPPNFGIPCDFGVCNPIGNDFVSGITGLGTPGSPFTLDVLVLAPFLQSIFGSGGPIRPFTLQFPNVPPGSACSKYASGALRAICNAEPNSPTNNCVRGYLLGRYDPNSGYQGGIRGAHCESFAACGMSPWNPAQIGFGCYVY